MLIFFLFGDTSADLNTVQVYSTNALRCLHGLMGQSVCAPFTRANVGASGCLIDRCRMNMSVIDVDRKGVTGSTGSADCKAV